MDAIRIAFDRCVKALTARPSIGRSTSVSRTRIRQGLVCDIEEGPWRLVVDMSEKVGGSGSAPTPGVFGRAAFGSCLAICYMMHAAKLGVPITSLEVEVQADYDNAGLFGVGSSAPGYSEVRYTVTVESPAPEHEIARVLDDGDAHSPYLDIFRRAQTCRRSTNIISTAATTPAVQATSAAPAISAVSATPAVSPEPTASTERR